MIAFLVGHLNGSMEKRFPAFDLLAVVCRNNYLQTNSPICAGTIPFPQSLCHTFPPVPSVPLPLSPDRSG